MYEDVGLHGDAKSFKLEDESFSKNDHRDYKESPRRRVCITFTDERSRENTRTRAVRNTYDEKVMR